MAIKPRPEYIYREEVRGQFNSTRTTVDPKLFDKWMNPAWPRVEYYAEHGTTVKFYVGAIDWCES